ncbi:MAG: HlyD family efflux transporter periplasmic adaptor subunit [Anaerolineae bacterium]|nr:HlyD family efflux transporter periplasmic adaptor subunit [Anaerolineae bacterium]
MRRVLRILIMVVVLSMVVLLAFQIFQYQQTIEAAQSAQVVIEDETTVRPDELVVTVSGTGSITPVRQVALTFELSAPVKVILVQEGAIVTAGDVLAELDTNDLEAALVDAEIAFEGQQASYNALLIPPRDVDIAAAQAVLNAALAQAGAAPLGASDTDLEIARIQAEIARNQLYQQQLQRDLTGVGPDNVTTQVQLAEDQVELADVTQTGVQNEPADVAALSAANAQIVAAQVRLDRLINGPSELELQIAGTQLEIAHQAVEQAQLSLSRAVLVAPFDGIISDLNLVVGEAPPQDAAFQLVDFSGYYVDVAVDETDVVNIQMGQMVDVVLDALPSADINGQVTRVAQTPTRSGQLVTYAVRVTLDPTDENIRVGMSATAIIVINEIQNVLVLPNRFIRIDRTTQQAYVTVANVDGTFTDTPVILGVRNETESQILNGLESGQRIVLLPRGTFNPLD